MKKQTALLCLTLFVVTSSPILFAEEEGQPEEANTERVHPRDLSPEERKEMRKKFRKHRGKMAEGMLQEIDKNGDEMVDLNEFLSHSEARFNEMDADKDGLVTKDEARAHHRELRKKHHEMRKKMHKHREDAEASDE